MYVAEIYKKYNSCLLFFKPDHIEYPVVNLMKCYYRSLEDCYSKFCDHVDRLNGVVESKDDEQHLNAEAADYFVFHAPTIILTRKGVNS